MRSSRAAIVVGLVLLATAVLVYSFSTQDDVSPAMTASQETQEAATGSAAMRASIDPETGELTSGHLPVGKVEDAELQEALSRSSEGLVEVHHPDGSVSIDLQGRFHNASMARIDSTGKLQTTCVDSQGAAHAFCRGKHVAEPEAEER